jgi:MFS family permease
MSGIRLAEPRPQQPQATPDGNGIASLILGIVGLAMLPVIGGLLAVIFGHISARDAHERGERPSAMATAGTILGWIGLIVPLAAFVILFFTGLGWPSGVAMAVLIAAISALVIYLRRNNRR